MNQEIEKAIIDQTNKVWEQALKVGISDERERIIKLFETRLCFDKYDCDDDRCKTVMAFIGLIKGETK